MKKIFLVCVISLTHILANGQDCKSLNSFTSYHGIKFGEKFPDSLKIYFTADTLDDGSTFWYSMPFFYTDAWPKYEKFKSWFKFKSEFAILRFICNKDRQVMRVTLEKYFTDELPVFYSPKNYPSFYDMVITELSLLFGIPTVSDNKFTDEKNTNYVTYWKCDKVNTEVAAYFSHNPEGYKCTIMIEDAALLKKHQIDMYR